MSSTFDTLVRGGRIVTPSGVRHADIGISEGRFALVAESISGAAAETIDGTGLHIFPGILDAHVHFNEPGRTEWEGLASGSAALAAGGGTWFCDMPLNSSPPVINVEALAAKQRLAAQKSLLDYSLWGGLVPDNFDHLEGLRDAGALGLKAFMCHSGLDEFPAITDSATLRAGMKRAAALDMLVAVHAEDDALAAQLSARQQVIGRDARAWLGSRPVEVELTAIRTALDLAGETGCRLHVVHVSSPDGIALITDAKRRGVDVSAETCPHYLLLNQAELLIRGAAAKCAPPLRPESMRQGLWRAVESGGVDTIGSDHSPAPPEMKMTGDFFAVWGGISGCQHGFPLLLSEALARSGPQAMPRFTAMLAANVARRFRLPRKGSISEGFDADFTLLDLEAEHALSNSQLLYCHRQGPYDERRCTVLVRQTFARGRRVCGEGGIAPDAPRGSFIRPSS